MYNVMLIDDDVPVVEYLRILIPWADLGLRVDAEAYSAAEAMERFEQTSPDILITDIGLPDGNGIELARRFRAMRPELRVIFLTCHEDFNYVKEALRIEADDYFVKDELDRDAMVETLHKAVSKLASEQDRLEQLAFKSDLQRNRDSWLHQLLQAVMHHSQAEELRQHARRLGIDWTGANFAAAAFHLDIGELVEVYNREHLELIHYAAYNIASELSAGEGITPFPAYDHRLWAVACSNDTQEAIDSLLRFADNFQSKLLEFLKIHAYVCVAGEACDLSGLGRMIEQTSGRFELEFYERSNGRVVSRAEDAASDAQLVKELESLSFRWVEALADGNRSSAHIYLSNMEKTMREAAYDPKKAKSWLSRCVQEANVRFDLTWLAGFSEDIARTVRVEEAYRMMRWYTDQLIRHIRPSSIEEQTNPDLKVIDAYIYEHIYQNISSIDIARHLHLNPSYFSRYFKKLTGMIFTDHVHLIKLEEAKRLLASGETAEQTAYMLGYSDRAYFSRVFKKYTGMSPSEYKPGTRVGEERT